MPPKTKAKAKGRVMYLLLDRQIEFKDYYASTTLEYADQSVCAVIPCRSAKEARAIIALHARHTDIDQLMQRIDLVLTMIPHRGRDDNYMRIFGEEYVTPLVQRLRGTAALGLAKR